MSLPQQLVKQKDCHKKWHQTNEDKSEMNVPTQHICDDKPKYNLKVQRLLI
jgi:hypothetical protein